MKLLSVNLIRKTVYVFLVVLFVFSIISNIKAGSISGYITDENTSQPISGLDLNLYDENWTYVPINAISDSGSYTFFNVTAGTYYVKANPKWDLHYRAEYWDDSFDRDSAILIPVQAEEDVTGIDFQLTDGYYIGGKVLDANGAAINGIDLNVYDMDWNKMDVDAETDEGRYYIGGLPPGDYYVKVNPIYAQPYIAQYWDHSNGPDHADPVTIVDQNDTLGINFDLINGSYIVGNVKDQSTQTPLSGLSMKAYNSDGQKMRIEDTTKQDGSYILGAYRSGDYFIRADPSYPDGYMDMYYPQSFSFDTATAVTITAPKPTTGIDFSLPAGSYIRGNISSVTVGSLENIKTKFYGSDWFLYELSTTFSKSTGDYLSGALKPGMYYVKAVPIYPQPYIDEYYDDATEKEDASPIEVIITQETTNIDFILESGGYLLGTVLDESSGDPVIDVDMDLYNGSWEWVDYSDHTDNDGDFLIGAIPFGNYFLRCDPSNSLGYIPEYYDDAFWPIDADLITLSASAINVSDLDFDLADGGKVSGRITDEDQGIPIPDIPIEVYTTDWELLPIRIVDSRSDGKFTAHGIPTGNYYVKAAPEATTGYSPEYYQEAANKESAVTVLVSVGSTTAGVNFTLKASDLGVVLEMPGEMFYPGDQFYLNAKVNNSGVPLGELPLFVVLDVFGVMFFWPSWTKFDPPEYSDIDYSLIEVTTGVQTIPILQAFTWPPIGGPEVTGLYFYGALVSSDFSELIGDMDTVTFGYGPG